MSADYEAIDQFIADHFVEHDAALRAALQDSDKAGLPQIQVAPHQGKLLMLGASSKAARAAAIARAGSHARCPRTGAL